MAQPVFPCLWFTNNAQAAAEFYVKVFPNSRITQSSPIVVNFELNGQPFMALNDRRPPHHFNEAVSFVINCKDQQEIDYYWQALALEGGKESMCGWCSDRFGVSWQVVPAELGKLMSDPARAPRVIAAFLKMKKFDLAALRSA
ncbi:MAG: VOC family protein [Cyclobacteriaceae bacterium]